MPEKRGGEVGDLKSKLGQPQRTGNDGYHRAHWPEEVTEENGKGAPLPEKRTSARNGFGMITQGPNLFDVISEPPADPVGNRIPKCPADTGCEPDPEGHDLVHLRAA